MRPAWQEKRRRIEAARAYAEIASQDDLGERIGFKPPRMRRYLGGDGEFTVDELAKIAEVCGVPAGFLLAGWEGAALASAPPADEGDPETAAEKLAEAKRLREQAESDDATGSAGGGG